MKTLERVLVGDLGRLSVIQVLDWMDGPKIVGVRANEGQVYLAYWLDRVGGAEEWVFVPTSARRYADVVEGRIDLRTAILGSEVGSVARVRFVPSATTTVEWTLARDLLNSEMLPLGGERLSEQPPFEDLNLLPSDVLSQPAPEQKAIAELMRADRIDSLSSGRERVTVRLQRTAHEVAARVLSNFLRDLQLTVDGLALSTSSGTSGLNVLATVAASFDLELISEAKSPAPDSKVTSALAGLFSLMHLGSNKEQLSQRLAQLPRRTAGRYMRFVVTLQKLKSDATFIWASSVTTGDPVRVAALTAATQNELADFLAAYDKKEAEPYTVSGRLLAIHLRKRTFELDTESDAGLISGRYAKTAEEAAKEAKMNHRYVGTIHDAVELNAATGQEKIKRTLITLEPEQAELK